ncbi:MAG: DUF1292 domain-containing protein [Oscillospiraceae bacterium]|jgi:uncharacterized protein YrzB (UPF0473 family)|nr:DUF1292 domain-containing protein [Oscillospiraceae bacterium]
MYKAFTFCEQLVNNVKKEYVTMDMDNEFGSDFITITDDDGKDYVLEHVDTFEIDDVIYMAFLPTDIDEESDEYGLIILKVDEEDDEEILATIDDEMLLDSVYERFMERLSE